MHGHVVQSPVSWRVVIMAELCMYRRKGRSAGSTRREARFTWRDSKETRSRQRNTVCALDGGGAHRRIQSLHNVPSPRFTLRTLAIAGSSEYLDGRSYGMLRLNNPTHNHLLEQCFSNAYEVLYADHVGHEVSETLIDSTYASYRHWRLSSDYSFR